MNESNPPFLNILTGAKNPNRNPIINTKIIFFNFRLDFPELDELELPIVVLGIEEYSLISFSRVF